MLPNRVFIAGYPSDVGGANTELWHLIKMFRSQGLGVTLLTTWGEPPVEWRRRVAALGCETVAAQPEELDGITGLTGSVVISLCNSHFLRHLRKFDRLGCRLVWLGCMNWMFPHEAMWIRVCGQFDAAVFQSEYQRAQLAPQIEKNCEFGKHEFDPGRLHVIPGAFDPAEFPFRPRPREPGEPFVIGRLSAAVRVSNGEPALDKFSRNLWAQYSRIVRCRPGTRARVMGWDDKIAEHCGAPPEWAECLSQGTESPQEFLAQCHALVPGVRACAENWPRVGLEALSAGVPLVVESKGGWPQMLVDGAYGACVRDVEAQTTAVLRLIDDEPARLTLARMARKRLDKLTDVATIWGRWKDLLEGLDCERTRRTAAAVSVAG